MNQLKVLVMYATDYSIQDESNPGRVNEGCTIQYYFFGDHGENLTPQLGNLGPDSGPVGYQRAKCSAKKEVRAKIKRLPAIYDATFEMSVGSDGKAVQKIVDLNNPVEVDFSKILAAPTKTAATAAAAAK